MSAFSDEGSGMFVAEAEELLDPAETRMLSLDKGAELRLHYDPVFRALHSIKGAAGMGDFDGAHVPDPPTPGLDSQETRGLEKRSASRK